VAYVIEEFHIPERRACKVLGQPRSSQRYITIPLADEAPLTAAIIELSSRFGRYGYRRITGLLRIGGWWVNHKRVERIWRAAGLKVPQRQPKRSRLCSMIAHASGYALNTKPCLELRLRNDENS